MGRPMKPLPASARSKLKKNVAEQEARLSFIWNLMLEGADIRTIRAHVFEKFGVGKDTVEDDVRSLRDEATRIFKEEREHLAARYLAQLDRIALQFKQAAQDAKQEGDLAARNAALAGARQTVKDMASLAGVLQPQQVQVTGAIAHAVAAVDTDQMRDFVRALEHAHLTPAEGARLIDA